MKTVLTAASAALVLLQIPVAFTASYPRTIKSEEITEAPMTKMTSRKYIEYSNDPMRYKEYEEREQKSPAGTEKTFYLREGGKVHMYEPGTGKCTITDMSSAARGSGQRGNPGQVAESMRNAMGMKEAGSCSGAGRPGKLFTSSMGQMCFDKEYKFFPLWSKMMGSETKVVSVAFNVELGNLKLHLPDKVKCEKGPDLQQILKGMKRGP